MKSNIVLAMCSMLTLAGCGGPNGPTYASLEKHKLSSGKAELVVYHPNGEFTGSVPLGSGPDVKVNGKTVCSLPNGSFFVTSVAPGDTSVSSTKALAIGTSTLNITAKPNNRYFIRVTWNGASVWGTAGAGLAGEVIANSTSSNGGPFV